MGGKAADHSGEDRRCAPLTDLVKERAATELGPGKEALIFRSFKTNIYSI
ncbi:hypothetical protein Cdeb_00909 [Caldibacillus debilis GB1]|uniref:Uncharacterized protein n=1 Tax=Caldibacillus debilis GB1 TaxID=1339248 RepID=A0A420VF48_9BACI|nr:hypothetical protein Cdeb_00909 [Caldibacillus debilis GB1]